MAEQGPSDDELIKRIIAWRAAGWSFQQIGARLEAEGFAAKQPEHWEREVLRHLVRQRKTE
jgi:DNA-binding transcriptional MerR regulator